MRRRSPRSPTPPLRRRQARRVQLELPRRGIVGGRGLERADRGAVRELGVEVAAEDAAGGDEGAVFGVQVGPSLEIEDGLEGWGEGE